MGAWERGAWFLGQHKIEQLPLVIDGNMQSQLNQFINVLPHAVVAGFLDSERGKRGDKS